MSANLSLVRALRMMVVAGLLLLLLCAVLGSVGDLPWGSLDGGGMPKTRGTQSTSGAVLSTTLPRVLSTTLPR